MCWPMTMAFKVKNIVQNTHSKWGHIPSPRFVNSWVAALDNTLPIGVYGRYGLFAHCGCAIQTYSSSPKIMHDGKGEGTHFFLFLPAIHQICALDDLPTMGVILKDFSWYHIFLTNFRTFALQIKPFYLFSGLFLRVFEQNVVHF